MATFSLADSPTLPPAALFHKNSRDWEEFASALLEDGLNLTALELYTELLESGRDLQCLRDFFSNPGNFEHTMPQPSSSFLHNIVRTSSLSTFDSIELGHFSDDLDKENDDKVAVLEFELRKAYDTIKSLRGSLTEATEILPMKSKGEIQKKQMGKSDEPVKPHEKRALNFLTHEYFMQQNFKLTAITLTEENGDQDFDDWDDVGLNIPKPPTLLHLFRNYSSAFLSDKERLDRIEDLDNQLSLVTGQCLALKRENEALQLRLKKKISVSSVKSESARLHRRGSSLVNQAEAGEFLTGLKDHPKNRSSPEIDSFGVKKVPAKEGEGQLNVGQSDQAGTERKDSGDTRVEREEEERIFNGCSGSETDSATIHKGERSSSGVTGGGGGSGALSVSTYSEISTQSDVTLSDLNHNIDQGRRENGSEEEEVFSGGGGGGGGDSGGALPRKNPHSLSSTSDDSYPTRDERTGTISSDMSGSCSTLQNERGEMESSLDQAKKMQMSVKFRQELLSVSQLKTDSRVGLEVIKLTEPSFDLVQLLGRSLPHIVPNVSLSKREELVPVLLGVLSQQSDSKSREQLLHMIFNLIKKPDKGQRQIIMSSCVSFAKISGTTRVESELLPQMWEQITHKHYERRLLVAESCGVLAPYIPPELRSSLVLSMLKQMLVDDKAESVRQAVVKSLGVIVAFIDDDDKFKHCWELMLRGLNDPSQLVVTSVYGVLLPALAAWSYELGSLENELISYFSHQLLTCIKQVSRTDGESGAVEQSQNHILTLTHLVPWHYATIIQTGPYCETVVLESEDAEQVSFPKPLSPLLDISIIIGDEARLSALVAGFKKEISSKGFSPWKSLEWFQNEFLSKIMRVTVALGFSQSELVHSLSNLLSVYCTYFGHTYTHEFIKPYFERCLKLPKHNPGAALVDGRTQLTTPVLPVYVSGVLGCFNKDNSLMVSYLRGVIVDMALNFGPLDSLRATLAELCRERRHHAILLRGLQDLSNHSSFQVRRYVAILLGVMVRKLDEKMVLKIMVPLLMELSRDSEISVKVDTIDSFGIIMETVASKDVLMKVHEQFEVFMSGDQFQMEHQLLMAVLKTLAKIGSHADPVFRDEFIVPKLADVATMNNVSQNITKREDVTLALLESYSNISECFMSLDLLITFVIPGLESVQRDIEDILPDKMATVEQLLENFNAKVQDYKKQELVSENANEDGRTTAFLKKFRPSFDRTDLNISTSKFFKRKT